MKFQHLSFAFLAARALVASPVPAIEWVTVTHYTTVSFGYSQFTHDFPPTSIATSTSSPSTSVIAVSDVTSSIADTSATAFHSASQSSTSQSSTLQSSTLQSSTFQPLNTQTSAAQTSSAPTSPATVFSGDGTYYETGLGACGIYNVDTDYICAMSHLFFDQYTPNGNPNHNTLCGKKINAFYNGKTVQVTVTDRCEACAYADLDFSPSAFSQLADQSLGRIKITWEWA